MMGLPLGFAQPLVLVGLLSLPLLWWLLRLVPPRPRRISFPPTRLLFDIAPREETPARCFIARRLRALCENVRRAAGIFLQTRKYPLAPCIGVRAGLIHQDRQPVFQTM